MGVHAITIQSDFHRACSALWKMEEHTLVVSNSLVDQTSYKIRKITELVVLRLTLDFALYRM